MSWSPLHYSAPPVAAGDLAVTIIVAIVALVATVATLLNIGSAKLRPKGFSPLLFLSSLTLLISLTISIATNIIIHSNSPLQPFANGSSVTRSFFVTAGAGDGLFLVFEIFLFAAMFVTLDHRLYSPIALAATPGSTRWLKVLTDWVCIALFVILGLASISMHHLTIQGASVTLLIHAPRIEYASAAFYLLAHIDVIITTFYVRSRLQSGKCAGDQITRSLLVIVVPLLSLRAIYDVIAKVIPAVISISAEGQVALVMMNRLVLGLTALAIIGTLLRWGTRSREAAWEVWHETQVAQTGDGGGEAQPSWQSLP